ncbi:BA75_00091T0 [Komagataella pastoris]|uniref:BA75_00091T0 n=1 Tax=Komagataella pastoris TaxID=4922 RepID=A0A1B2JA18_PICPA|nr:BA75_00091T0 [Komagataella pastoris]
MKNESDSSSHIKSNTQKKIDELVFGSVAGALGKVVEYPLDTIKVRLQYSSGKTPEHPSTWKVITQTYKHEGFFNGFYKGLSSPLMGAAAECSSLFFSYELAQDWVKSYKPEITLLDKIYCGAFSGVVTSFILTPIELVKCKMQVINLQMKSEKPPGIARLVSEIYKSQGLKGLWKGQVSTMIRETGGTALWFGAYEYVLILFNGGISKDAKSNGTSLQYIIAGGVAGAVYNASFYPVDTIKSMIQTEQSHHQQVKTTDIIFRLWRARGLRGFYSGLGITLLKSVPANGIVFFTHQTLKNNFA